MANNNPIDLLRDLIRTKSQNPTDGETAMVQLLSDYLRDRQMPFRILSKDTRRPNLICELPFGDGGPTVILNGHTDTKPADRPFSLGATNGEWPHPPFIAHADEAGNIHGRGACDMKAGVAAILFVAARLWADRKNLLGQLRLEFVADEENGSAFGMHYLNSVNAAVADLAIVAEPTNGALCLRSLGNLWIELSCRTRESHAGYAWKWPAATNHLVAVLARLQEGVFRYASEKPDPDYPNHPTLNIGILKGGFEPGTAPGYAQAVLDFRLRIPADRSGLNALVGDLCRTYTAETSSFELRSQPYLTGGFEPVAVSPDDTPAIASFVRVAAAAGVGKSVFYGASDAALLVARGVPAVVWGPGSLEDAHVAGEYVRVSEYLAYIEQLTTVLQHTLRRG